MRCSWSEMAPLVDDVKRETEKKMGREREEENGVSGSYAGEKAREKIRAEPRREEEGDRVGLGEQPRTTRRDRAGKGELES